MDILEYIKKMQEMYGEDVITTADKIKRPDPKPIVKDIEAINEFMKRNPQADGGRIGFKKKGFVSGIGTGVKGIDDPEKYKIVKKYLNKVKSQKNKKIFLDWSEQIGNKKTKWYTDLSKEVQLSRDPLNKLINKVTLEEFPTAYAGKFGRVNYAREMVVKSFIDYWNQNGAFDGNEKLSKILNQFQKDSVNKRFENINRYFMDWKEGKFEVPGVDRKNLDKNLLKDIKNYKPNAKDVRSLTVAKQLKYLDGLSSKYSFDTVEKLFAKQFPDNAQTLQHRLNQLTQLKRNGAYNTGAGNVQKIATIKTGDRPKWLIEGYGKGFKGNYGNLIKKADDLLAAGDKVSAKRLYKAADKFFSPNGIFTKAAGEGEHPLSRNMGDGPIGNQLKINSLVSGDLNQFKKFNFDSPVRNAVLEYNNSKTTDARRADLKIEIENRKKLMNILTEGPNQKGIVDSVKFNYGPKTLTASVDVVDIDKVKNFDINEYITRGDDYRKSLVIKGEKLGLIDKSGNITKQKIGNVEKLLKSLCPKGKASGGRIGYQDAGAVGKTLQCGINQFNKNMKTGNANSALMRRVLANGGNILSSVGKQLNPVELLKLRNLIGPQALGYFAAYEAGVITDDVLRKGIPLNESVAKNWLTKSFVPFSEEFAKQKNLLKSGTLNKNQRIYALDMMKVEKAFKEMDRIEGMERDQLVEGTMDDDFIFNSQEKIDAAKTNVNRIVEDLDSRDSFRNTGKQMENIRAMDEMEASRMAKIRYSPIFGKLGTPLVNKLARPARTRGPMTAKKEMKIDYSLPTYDRMITPTDQDILNTYRQYGVISPTEFKTGVLQPGEGTLIRMMEGGQGLYGTQFATGGIVGDKSGPPPTGGPMSQGLRSLYNNGKKL